MQSIIESNLSKIIELSELFHVSRLELFGSALGPEFDENSSDIDFLVEFNEQGIKNYADCFFGLKEALEELFSRPIDLVVISSLRNPYLLKSIENNKALLYAA